MVGQGRPRPRHALARVVRHIETLLPVRAAGRILAGGLTATWMLLCVSATAWAEPTLNLRIAWGSGVARQWQGTVSVDRGAVSNARPLSLDADEPGSMWLDSGRLEIRQRSARQHDGVDLTVTAPPDAKLTFEFREAFQPDTAAVTAEVSLEELAGKSWKQDLDKTGNRLMVRRAPGDMLRVALHQDHLVYWPGDSLQIDVEPRLLPVAPGTAIQLRGRLLSPGNGNQWAIQEASVKTTAEDSTPPMVTWQFELPQQEGAYELVIEALEPTSLRWTRPKTIAERRVQLVVVADRPPPPAPDANTSWSRIMEIDPANPRWYERFRTLLPGLAQGPLGSGLQIGRHALGAVAQLGPNGSGAGTSWEAYPLTIGRPGTPHILEVEYPSDVPQTLGISIVEPNAAGRVTPIGLDSGFYIAESEMPGGPKMLRHRLLFWPHSKTPIALLTNRRDGTRATYTKIQVLAGPSKLPRATAAGDLPERLIAGYMARPLVPENFGAAEAIDPVSGRSVDDWQTFYDAAARLAEYLNYVGYGGQMLTVMTQGSTIYPSTLVEPTLQYDTGAFFELGQDPVRKDVLELALRIFDRERLKLIPALQFSAPLPELEAKLRQGGPDAQGIELVGADGAPYLSVHLSPEGAGPYYNPLNQHVQDAMAAVVQEIVRRYSRHPSFAGLAIELSAEGYAQLPGESWGLDDATIARFERETGLQVSAAGQTKYPQRAKLLADSQLREAWLRWRAGVMSQFYKRLQTELTAARRDANLYLAATNLFDSPDAQRALRPSLPAAARADEMLLSMGIRVDELRAVPGLVVLRPQRLQPPGPLATQAIDIELNRSTALDEAFRGPGSAASLFVHEPQKLSLPAFDAQSPFGRDKTTTWMASHMSPGDYRNRQRFVHALASMDSAAMFDGGWMLPLGQEESAADFVAAYRRLPIGKFETCAEPTEPVTIRILHTPQNTYLYLVNDSQWPATTRLQLEAPPGCWMQDLSGRRRLPAMTGANWTITLEPFDLVAVVFGAGDVRIAKAELLPDEQPRAGLERRVRELQQRVATLANPPQVNVLTNADFESPAKGAQIPGWLGDAALGSQGSNPPQGKRPGKQAAGLTSDGPVASLKSDPIPAPPTGRLGVSVWLRVDDVQNQPTVRLVIEGALPEKPYYRWGQVGAGVDPIPAEWKQYVLPINDIPAADLGKLRVRFDLMGKGQVWIDDVQVFDLFFDGKEQVQLSKIVALADFQLRSGKLTECVNELEGYWPRFLETYVPLDRVAVARQEAAAKQGPDGQPTGDGIQREATKPGTFDWLRGKLR